jgi:hypothetical protein
MTQHGVEDSRATEAAPERRCRESYEAHGHAVYGYLRFHVALTTARLARLVTLERCCPDFDGGGPSDDGSLVVGVPPDRVVMAAISERGPAPPDAALR